VSDNRHLDPVPGVFLGLDFKGIDFSFNTPSCSEYLLLPNWGQLDDSR